MVWKTADEVKLSADKGLIVFHISSNKSHASSMQANPMLYCVFKKKNQFCAYILISIKGSRFLLFPGIKVKVIIQDILHSLIMTEV